MFNVNGALVPKDTISIHIHVDSGYSIRLEVALSDTLQQIKLKIQAKHNIRTDLQHLTFMGKSLANDFKLSDYDFQPDSTLELELGLPTEHEAGYENSDQFAVCDIDKVWQEPRDDTLHTYIGSSRNFHYKSQGRFLHARILNECALLDQTLELPQNSSRAAAPVVSKELSPDFKGYKPSASSAATLYDSLLSPNSIRLLELLPGEGNCIESRLYTCDIIAAKENYEAISYSSNWRKTALENLDSGSNSYADTTGDASAEPIFCNGEWINTSPTLVEALRHLRLQNKPRLLWVADLCVNTANASDRNHNTILSTKIFQNASRVVVWLGRPRMTRDEMGFYGICKIVNRWRISCGFAPKVPHAKVWTQNAEGYYCTEPTQDMLQVKMRDAWLSAIETFQRRWFSSVWSLKETAVASPIVFMLGHQVISWDWVGLAAAILRENYSRVSCTPQPDEDAEKPSFPAPGILQAYFLYRLSQSQLFLPPLRLSVSDLLSATRSFRCSCRHDRIYVICDLPMVDSSATSAINIDYSKDIHTVYWELATLLVQQKETCLPFLGDVHNTHGSHLMKRGPWMKSAMPLVILKGPSWVPNWDSLLVERIAPLNKHAFATAATRALPQVQISEKNDKLAIFGVMIDTVKQAVENHMHNTFWRGEENDQRNIGFLSQQPTPTLDAMLLANKVQARHLPALALTLTCGKDWHGQPVSDVKMHVADYAQCLLKRGLEWSLSYTASCIVSQDKQVHVLTEKDLREISHGGSADRFLDATATMGKGRSRIETTGGLFAIGPDSASVGDILCIFHGLEIPYLLRPNIGTGNYILLGECYVHEVVRGPTLGSDGQQKSTWIVLE